MNHDSFEKMDREFLEGLKTVRDRKIPDEIRNDFKRSVEKRLAMAGKPAAFGLSFAAIPAVVLVLGAVLFWFYLKPGAPVRELAPEKNVPAETGFQKNEIQAPAAEPMPVQVSAVTPAASVTPPPVPQRLVQSNVQIDAQPAAAPSVLSQITESNLVSELEALKDLGVWTDQDEEEIGISADQIFEELESLASELLFGNTVNPPQASAQ